MAEINEQSATGTLAWDASRTGVRDGCFLFMAMDGNIDVAGAIDIDEMSDHFPDVRPFNEEAAKAAFPEIEPAMRRAVAGAYRMGHYREIWDAPGILRHRRVLVSIGSR